MTTIPSVPRERGRPRARTSAVRATLLIILVMNCMVVVVKTTIGLRTHSLAVLGAALESGLDALGNLLAIILVQVAATGPDEEHPYGHEKFETLGALAIVGFLSITCFELLRRSIEGATRGAVLATPSRLELALITGTMGVNALVVWLERRRGRQLDSALLLADATHTRSDLYVTGAALLSLALAHRAVTWIDPLLAVLVALVIARNGVEIVRGSIPVLVDERGVDAARIRDLLESIPQIREVRRVRSRVGASGAVFAEVTIGVDGAQSVSAAHAVADEVESRISAELGDAEVLVHVEPS